jgi:hypothetical protein
VPAPLDQIGLLMHESFFFDGTTPGRRRKEKQEMCGAPIGRPFAYLRARL